MEAIDEKLVGTWELQRLDGLGEEGALPDGMRRVPTLIVQPDGRIGGFGGTNQYFGRLDTDAAARGEFRAREVGSTLMAGPHDDVERAFHRHLQASNRVSIDGDELTLRHADGSEARFRRAGAPADPDADANAGASPEAAPDAQPPAHDEPIHVDALVGSWRLADFLGDGPALPGGEPPTLKVEADGRIAGFAGVNRYFGSLDRDALAAEGRLIARNIGMTRMAGPPQRMQLEQRFAQSLQRGGQVRIDGDTLEVRNDDGSGLRFERVE